MLKKRLRENPKQKDISQPLTYNRFFPNINKVIRKNCNLLAINESLKETFNYQPTTAFKRNKNLKELIGSNKLEMKNVKKRQIEKLKTDKGSQCLINSRSLCCKKKRKTTTLKSQQTQKIYKIFHNVNCSRRSLRNGTLFVLTWWRGWRACVGGALAWMAWVESLRGWCASVGGVGGILAWVAC